MKCDQTLLKNPFLCHFMAGAKVPIFTLPFPKSFNMLSKALSTACQTRRAANSTNIINRTYVTTKMSIKTNSSKHIPPSQFSILSPSSRTKGQSYHTSHQKLNTSPNHLFIPPKRTYTSTTKSLSHPSPVKERGGIRNMEPSMTTAKGLQTTWFMRLMQAVSATRLVSEKVRGGRLRFRRVRRWVCYTSACISFD